MTKVYEASFGQENISHVSSVTPSTQLTGTHPHGTHPHLVTPQWWVQSVYGPFTKELDLIIVGPFQLGIFCDPPTLGLIHTGSIHSGTNPPGDSSTPGSTHTGSSHHTGIHLHSIPSGEGNPITGIKPSRPQWQQSPFIPLLFLWG